MKTPPHVLVANRNAERAAARSAVELEAARERARTNVEKARSVLRDSIAAAGLSSFTSIAILSAAESYAKACILSMRFESPCESEASISARKIDP